MNVDLTALKAAAFDAAGAALEVRDAEGAAVLANAASDGGGGSQADALRPIERLVEGRAKLVDERQFTFDGRDYRVVAAFDFDAQRRMQDDLFMRAYFDASTGLPNRELCERAIADLIAARADGRAFAIVFVELDRFHEIVAFHGAAASETLAAKIGERLAREAKDLVARVGPDEFCLVIAEPGAPEDALAACAKWVEQATEPCLVDGVEIFAAASAGLCFWPAGDTTVEGSLRKAKAAAREARRAGGSARLFETKFERASVRERVRRTPCGRRCATAALAAPSNPNSTSAPARSIGSKF